MAAQSTIRIDLDALEANLRAIGAHCGGGPERICAVVKADAYGLGAGRMAGAMGRIGIGSFATYGPEEAVEVADATSQGWVLVLMPLQELPRDARTVALLGQGRLHVSAHALQQVRDLEAEAGRLGVVLPLHLELETGMGRGGSDPEEAEQILRLIHGSRRLRLAGVFTHLPDAVDDPVSAINRGRVFESFISKMGDLVPTDVVRHVAATASLESKSLLFDQVRVGLGWVGHGIRSLAGRPDPVSLIPIVSWWSKVIRVRRLPAGSSVGYGCTVCTDRETIAGIVPVGYADGLPSVPGQENHTVVVHGRRGPVAAPVLGRMNMDQFVVDLTDVGPCEAEIPVEILSADPESPASLERVAVRAGVSPYQLLCGIGIKVPRLLVTGRSLAPALPASSAVASQVRDGRRSIGH